MPSMRFPNAPLDKEQGFEFLTQQVAQSHPSIRALCYPKEIAVPPGYYSPELFTGVAYSCADEVTLARDYRTDKTTLAGHIACSLLIRYQVPTFFARPDLCDALMHTEPPSDTPVGELKMPFPAMLIMLPTDFTMRYVGRRVPFQIIATAPAKGEVKSPLRQADGGTPRVFELNNPEDGFFIFSCVLEPDGLPVFYDWRAPHSIEIAKIAETKIQYFNKFTNDGFDDPELDHSINIRLSMLAINLLMAMTAQPELVAREIILRPARKQDNRIVRRALWRPNFIGDNFKMDRDEGAGGSHASPHAHFRRGHMRNQKYGVGLSLKKLIWIKPVFVGLKIAA